MQLQKLIEHAKAKARITTDKELCDVLGVSHGAAHHWKTGRSLPQLEHINRLAELAEIDPAPLIIETLEEQATDPRMRKTLARFKRLLAAAVTGAICILCKKGKKPNERITETVGKLVF